VARLQEASAANSTRFCLHDGPEQQKRDEAMATSGDRSIANIGWLDTHDAAIVASAREADLLWFEAEAVAVTWAERCTTIPSHQ
jgi:hypothetical protein